MLPSSWSRVSTLGHCLYSRGQPGFSSPHPTRTPRGPIRRAQTRKKIDLDLASFAFRLPWTDRGVRIHDHTSKHRVHFRVQSRSAGPIFNGLDPKTEGPHPEIQKFGHTSSAFRVSTPGYCLHSQEPTHIFASTTQASHRRSELGTNVSCDSSTSNVCSELKIQPDADADKKVPKS